MNKTIDTQYSIYWCSLTPLSGCLNSFDAEEFKKVFSLLQNKKHFVFYFVCGSSGKEKIRTTLKSLTGILQQKYSVLFITDAQFGMINNSVTSDNPFFDVATTKQKQSVFII
jgi:hypothetical protein